MTDEYIIQQVLDGNTHIFSELVDRYKDRVFGMVCSFLQDREEAKDVSQEVFLKVYRNLHLFKSNARFSMWLYRECIAEKMNRYAGAGSEPRDEGFTAYQALKSGTAGYDLKRIRKSRFWTFVFGVVPGAAHMYLGLISKGLSLMILFFATFISTIIVTEFLYINWLLPTIMAPMYIICACYSVFDALSAAGRINAGYYVEDCKNIWFSREFMMVRELLTARKRTIGALMAGIGCLSILNIFARSINNFLNSFFNLGFSFSSFFAPTVLVIAGLLLIRRGSSEV